MINIWHRYPYFRLLIPFCIGIYVQDRYNFISPISNFLYILFAGFILTTIALYKSIWKNTVAFGILGTCTFILLGIFIRIHNTKNIVSPNKDHVEYIIEIQEPIKRTVNAYSSVGYVSPINHHSSSTNKCLIYFNQHQKNLQLRTGDVIFCQAKPKFISPPLNPNQFDFSKYYALNNIYHSVYLTNKDWIYLSNTTTSTKYWLNNYRSAFNSWVNRKIDNKNLSSILAALLTGNKNLLSKETKTGFSNTGIIHILAVSGLHVGIIYLIFSQLFYLLKNIRNGNIIKQLLLLIILWLYAFFTGLSPSVVRATSMLSFLIAGKLFNKDTNIYNIIAASAFFQLIINPKMLFDVGFQLSYIAVLGIIYLQPKIYAVVKQKNKWNNKILMLLSVTVAAQLVTAPLTVFYFHQFPTYFLLANVTAIPLVTIAVYGGIVAVILFKIVEPVADIFIYLAKYAVLYISKMSDWLNTIPYHTINIYYSSKYILILSFLMIIIITEILTNKRYYLIKFFLLSLLVILSIHSYNTYVVAQQKKIIVYSLKRQSAIEFINGNRSLYLTSTGTADYNINKDALGIEKRSVRNLSSKMLKYNYLNFLKSDNYLQFMNQRIVIIDKQTAFKGVTHDSCMPIDVLIIKNKIDKHLINYIQQNFTIKTIIVDNTIPLWSKIKYTQKLNQLCDKLHDLSSGAFVMDI